MKIENSFSIVSYEKKTVFRLQEKKWYSETLRKYIFFLNIFLNLLPLL